jgi:ABC-type nitrate/sulfonate/bicarbonate transport system permease component
MDPRLLEVGRNYGAHGPRLFGRIILPAVLPSIFTGLRLGLGLSLVAIVAVEFIAAKSGLGHLVYRHWQMLSTTEMYAAFALVGRPRSAAHARSRCAPTASARLASDHRYHLDEGELV